MIIAIILLSIFVIVETGMIIAYHIALNETEKRLEQEIYINEKFKSMIGGK